MDKYSEAVNFGLQALDIEGEALKPFQEKAILAYIEGKDVFCCVPTGSGKSRTYELAPYLIDYVHFGLRNYHDCSSVIIVIQPLVALMKEQVERLTDKGCPALYLGDNDLDIEGMKSGKYRFIFGAPESFLGQQRQLLLHKSLQDKVRLLVVDESHCVKKLGKDDPAKKERAFRKEYGRLGEVRSLCRGGVPVLALTATASQLTKQVIIEELNMEGCRIVAETPNKPNIRYCVMKVEDDLYSNFQWLIKELEDKGPDAERHLIFCKKSTHVSDLFQLFTISLGNKAYCPFKLNGQNDDRNRLFAMFHSNTADCIKETVRIALSTDPRESVLRIVFCTSAFGMGMDTKGVNTVIHYGPPSELDDYIQESGRIGRDASVRGHAILLNYTKSTSGKVSSAMKGYMSDKSGQCIRVLLFKDLDSNVKPNVIGHTCCSVCTKSCCCLCSCASDMACCCSAACTEACMYESVAEQSIKQYRQELEDHRRAEMWEGLPKVREVTITQQQCFLRLLLQYREAKSQLSLNTADMVCFSRSVLEEIVQGLAHVNSPEHIETHFPFFTESHVQAVWDIICDVLESDFTSDEESDSALSNELAAVVVAVSSDSD